jgi:hypothetical protein
MHPLIQHLIHDPRLNVPNPVPLQRIFRFPFFSTPWLHHYHHYRLPCRPFREASTIHLASLVVSAWFLRWW